MVRVTIWPTRRARYSSSWNSLVVRSMLRPDARDAPRERVDLQVRHAQRADVAIVARGAPQQRLDSRQQFGKRKRLDQVVIAARPQSLDAIIDRTQRAQHQHGRGHIRLAQRRDQRQSVELRQHAIDDQQVVARRACRRQPAGAVSAVLDRVAGLAQPAAHVAGGLDVVFDQQYLQRLSGVCPDRNSDGARYANVPRASCSLGRLILRRAIRRHGDAAIESIIELDQVLAAVYVAGARSELRATSRCSPPPGPRPPAPVAPLATAAAPLRLRTADRWLPRRRMSQRTARRRVRLRSAAPERCRSCPRCWPAAAARRELSAVFGAAEYAVLAALARKAQRVQRHHAEPVYILPGIMGTQLGSRRDAPTPADLLWLDPQDIIGRRTWSACGSRSAAALHPLGAIPYSYLPLQLRLRAAGYNVVMHDYDWRTNLRDAARDAVHAAVRRAGGERVDHRAQHGRPDRPRRHAPARLRARAPADHAGRPAPAAPSARCRPYAAPIRWSGDWRHSIGSMMPRSLATRVFSTFPSIHQLLPGASLSAARRPVRDRPLAALRSAARPGAVARRARVRRHARRPAMSAASPSAARTSAPWWPAPGRRRLSLRDRRWRRRHRADRQRAAARPATTTTCAASTASCRAA